MQNIDILLLSKPDIMPSSGTQIVLKLAAPATAKTITYLTDKKWEPKLLLYGKNGIAALTFCEVEIGSSKE